MHTLGLLIGLVSAPASAFEGVLHQTTTIAQIPPIASDVSLRENGDSRTDSVVPGTGEPLSVIRRANGTTLTLMHSKKMYSETPAQADTPPPGAADMLKSLQLKVIGDEPVAGHACKHVQLVQNKDTTIDVWMAPDLGINNEAAKSPQGMAAGMLKMLEDNGVKGFPLKMKATHLGQSLTLETVRIEVKKLDPAMFEAPKGYTKI